MKASELVKFIGRTGWLRVAGSPLRFRVEVLDVRERFGGIDYLLRAVAGEGEAWHGDAVVTLDEGGKS